MNAQQFHDIVKPYTMTSSERINCLFDSLEYIRQNNIKGDFIECGVWKGGNILGIINYLKFHQMEGNVWLYDTFAGMTEPSDVDIDHYNHRASDIFEQVKCFCQFDFVKSILSSTGFPEDKIKYVIGDVRQTLIQTNLPKEISLLRLDTDWYDSTKKELETLYPLLSIGGVLIVDDYGHWQGAKKAVDEYFANSNVCIENIDYTGIKIIKK